MTDTPHVERQSEPIHLQLGRHDRDRALAVVAKAKRLGMPLAAGYVLGLLDAGTISHNGVHVLLQEAIDLVEPPQE